jgi:hypothetical protein
MDLFKAYHLIMGVGPQDRVTYKGGTDLTFHEFPAQRSQYAMDHGGALTYFFNYTPEMIFAYVTHPAIEFGRRACPYWSYSMLKYTGVQGTNFLNVFGFRSNALMNDWIKPLIFADQWPEIIQRPKYTGMEKFATEYRERLLQYNRELFLEQHRPFIEQHRVHMPLQELIDYMTGSEHKAWYETPSKPVALKDALKPFPDDQELPYNQVIGDLLAKARPTWEAQFAEYTSEYSYLDLSPDVNRDLYADWVYPLLWANRE